MYQMQYVRENSRERSRSREKDKKKYNNNQNEQTNIYDRRYKEKQNKIKNKRVKQDIQRQLLSCFIFLMLIIFRFQGNDEIRVFRKEDEPSTKGLTQEQILKIKNEVEKQVSKSYDFNWQNFKHRDAVSQSNSMKEVKEREKALAQKLMSMKQSMSYVNPLMLCNIEKMIELGVDSVQREGHSNRIYDILGCYYTHVSQIPNQPQFQILNTNTTSESKLIKFDNEIFSNDNSFGNNSKKNIQNSKPLKGILKIPNESRERGKSQPRNIDPKLIYLLKDFKLNPSTYTKQRTEQLLKPYKDSGELDYLMKNKEVLQAMLKSTSNLNPIKTSQPTLQNNPSQYMNRQSREGRQSRESNDRNQRDNNHMVSGFNPNFVPKADKYRTVPCKYYHSPQGCSKIDNCTFIHDEKYAGQSVPNQANQNILPMPMNNQQRNNPNFTPMYVYQPISNGGGMSNMPQYMNSNIPNYTKPNPIGYFGSQGGNYPMQTHGHGFYSNPNPGQTPNTNLNNPNYGGSMGQMGYNIAGQGGQFMTQQGVQQGVQQGGQNFNPNYQYMLGKGDQYQNQNK